MTDHPTAPVQDDDAEWLREFAGQCRDDAANLEADTDRDDPNRDVYTNAVKDRRTAADHLERIASRLQPISENQQRRLSPTPETGLVEALPDEVGAWTLR